MIHGSTYNPALDQERLESLLHRVRNYMLTGNWVYLRELADNCGGSEAGISARIRQLRTEYKYGIEKKREGSSGLWVYRMTNHRFDEGGNGLLSGVA